MAQPQRPWGARTRIPSLEAGSGRPTGRAVAGDERGELRWYTACTVPPLSPRPNILFNFILK